MKKKEADSVLPEKNTYPVTINQELKPLKESDSPFLKQKMDQARVFLDKHGLPEGWGEWKKTEDSK